VRNAGQTRRSRRFLRGFQKVALRSTGEAVPDTSSLRKIFILFLVISSIISELNRNYWKLLITCGSEEAGIANRKKAPAFAEATKGGGRATKGRWSALASQKRMLRVRK